MMVGQGITVSANYSKFSGNKITNCQYGIILLSSQNSTVTENILQSIGLSAAIQLSYSTRNLIKNNYIDSCTEGIQLRAGSSNNMVIENIITSCQDVAIRLLGRILSSRWYNPNGNTIMRNNISNSGCGTTIYGSSKNIISNNENGIGLGAGLGGFSANNIIDLNVITGNGNGIYFGAAASNIVTRK